jgi:hypothetical protein
VSNKDPIPALISKSDMAGMLGVHENTITAMCNDGRLITDHKGRLRFSENAKFLIEKAVIGNPRPGRQLDLCREHVIASHEGGIYWRNDMLDGILALISQELGTKESQPLRAKLDKEFREAMPRYSKETLRVRRIDD